MSFGADYGYYSGKSLTLTFMKTGSAEVLLPLAFEESTRKHIATSSLGAAARLTDSFTIRARIRGRAASPFTDAGSDNARDTDFQAGDITVGAVTTSRASQKHRPSMPLRITISCRIMTDGSDWESRSQPVSAPRVASALFVTRSRWRLRMPAPIPDRKIFRQLPHLLSSHRAGSE
jgi:hypothetical protein